MNFVMNFGAPVVWNTIAFLFFSHKIESVFLTIFIIGAVAMFLTQTISNFDD